LILAHPCYIRAVRRVLILAAVAALLAGSGCGRDRLLGSGDGYGADESARAHRRKRPHKLHSPEPQEADADASVPSAPPGTPSIHLALGTPVDADPSDDWLMIKPQYALSYNPSHLGANWVSWELNAGYYGGSGRHKGKFIPDDSLPEGWYRVRHEDYSRTDYDRGHMVRSEERTRSREDNESTFLLTNILPQRHELNAGPWLRLEERCRELAQYEDKEMFITAGPIFGPHPATIGHGVAVPESFFKIVVVLGHDQGPADVTPDTRVIAVIMPNALGVSEEHWSDYRTSVAEIERRTGYRFLTNVPEATREALIQHVDDEP
jgi:endonuclease G